MAVRSGAGTGVVVSLVVFVLTTVFLLILTIVFYAGKTKELEARGKAEDALNVYARTVERGGDVFKAYESAAKSQGKSVAAYLNGRHEELMTYVSGQPSADIDTVKGELKRFGMKDTDSVRGRMQDMFRDLNARQSELDGLNLQVKSLNAQVAEKEAQMKQATEAHQQEINAVEGRIASYRDAAEENRKQMQEAVDELNKAKDSLRSRYEGRIRELENEVDTLNSDAMRLKGKIAEFEKARDANRMKAGNPAMLVDGRIIDVPGSSDQVFIDRGKKDRIVTGMTFEVYSEASQIRVNPQTGEVPRGKASLQVIKVADATSTCKITRATAGQPVIRNDVIANAVYDPAYRFKFLIHGKFDIDDDGRPTETEAEHLRSMVMEWGGAVVTGEELPGDLDFLVLGVEPPKPPPPPQDAPAVVLHDWAMRNAANAKYNQLFREARDAQIPVLNANRFFILIGYTER